MKYLDQLRFLLEASIRAAVESLKGEAAPGAGPVLRCSDDVLCELLKETGELCSMFGEHKQADLYYDK